MTASRDNGDRSVTRRGLLGGLVGAASVVALSGCDRLAGNASFREVLWAGESLSYRAHRLLLEPDTLAPEFALGDRSPVFRANGTTMPRSPSYRHHVETAFTHWRLRIDGLVQQPLSLSMAQLLRLPQRTQITRHDCVEGWSAIAQWQGTRLGPLLGAARLLPSARFAVFHCADDFSGTPYYESIDLVDAFHPQTILAHRLNGEPLPIANGAPLRLRVERQLGYKHAKYVRRIELVARLSHIGRGQGGYWEDRIGYDWYAGI